MAATTLSNPGLDQEAHFNTYAPKDDTECAMVGGVFDDDEEHEVFKRGAGVEFRTVGWPRATVTFLKVIFAVCVLAIPTAMYSLGAVGGALSVVAWEALHTYAAIIHGDFRNNHRFVDPRQYKSSYRLLPFCWRPAEIAQSSFSTDPVHLRQVRSSVFTMRVFLPLWAEDHMLII